MSKKFPKAAAKTDGLGKMPLRAHPPKCAASCPVPSSALSSPEYVYYLVERVNWPLADSEDPILFSGRPDVDKPFHIRLKESLWLSIENHCAALGVSKSEWVRVAMSKLLAEEQKWFLLRDANRMKGIEQAR